MVTKKKKTKKIRPMSLVKYDFDSIDKEWYKHIPLKKNSRLIFIGEILQVPGHGLFVDLDSKKCMVFHPDEFIEVPEDEA